MHTLHDVSPDEQTIATTKSLGSRCLSVVVCFLLLFLVNHSVFATPKSTPKSAPARVEVTKSASAKVKSKPPGKTVTKAKTNTTAKKKPKTAAQPLVSIKTKAKAEAITSEIATDLPPNIEQEINKFFGLRYRFGGDNWSGFDCSGLVKQVYADVFGVSLPRNSSEISRLGNLQYVPENDLKIGDLVFFGPNRKRVNHVGMYLAGGHFLHAARSEGVTISNLDDHYWKSRFMFSKRMRGLAIAEEDSDDVDLDRDLMRDYLMASYAVDDAEVRFLDFGIELNDSLGLLLSGFFLNSLQPPEPSSPVSESASFSAKPPEDSEGGFRLSAILTPLEWFKLIPSVSQTEGGRDDEGLRRQQKLGLETWMILPTSRVAVFMAAHARNQEDLFERPLGVNPDWQTMDVALGLHYHLSDSLRFSLWGMHSYNSDSKTFEESGRRNVPTDEMSFELNFKF